MTDTTLSRRPVFDLVELDHERPDAAPGAPARAVPAAAVEQTVATGPAAEPPPPRPARSERRRPRPPDPAALRRDTMVGFLMPEGPGFWRASNGLWYPASAPPGGEPGADGRCPPPLERRAPAQDPTHLDVPKRRRRR